MRTIHSPPPPPQKAKTLLEDSPVSDEGAAVGLCCLIQHCQSPFHQVSRCDTTADDGCRKALGAERAAVGRGPPGEKGKKHNGRFTEPAESFLLVTGNGVGLLL